MIKECVERHGCGPECVVGVGTGSGQALAYWTEVFRNCVGVDISAEQIKEPQKHSRTRERQMSTSVLSRLIDALKHSRTRE